MLPEGFIQRMKKLLGEDFAAFDAALSEPAVRGVRVNKRKISGEKFKELFPYELVELSYIDSGFIPEIQEGLGLLPEHHAGAFYSQDPGAMSAVCALDLKRGDRVLDACSAPGGKASQAADLIGEEGFLLANEYVPKRAKIIVGNFERLGIKNAIVTSLDTKELSRMFEGWFDAVICDAPCSGEGMFRKSDEAIADWSEENVRMCAERQLEILSNLAGVVREGGQLLYSTCTYSVEENEGVVEKFLESHPDFYISKVPDSLLAVTASGILPSENSPKELALTRRFYPHLSSGEGQFIALLKRRENIGISPTILYKDSAKLPSKQELAIIEGFLSGVFNKRPEGRIIKCGEGFALVTHGVPLPERSVFMSGVMLGEIRGKNFFPHHQLFSTFGKEMKQRCDLSREDPRVKKYLLGEEISAEGAEVSGYLAVCLEGVPMGGGKASGGVIKNHYPKGLRNK
ncbi:MAG: hypothetical protein IJE25_05880 [Clostridia bacterium]|nr:hypothetical protein [Clostridia bacterium]